MPQTDRVVDILAGRTAVGTRATVQGWIRTRRDSKAGLSFLHVQTVVTVVSSSAYRLLRSAGS